MKASIKNLSLALVAGVALFALVPAAHANILLPGDSKTPDLFSSAPGTLLTSNSQPITAATYSGTLTSAVYRNATGNPICPTGGCIDFYYQLTTLTGTGAIGRSTDFSFTGFQTDVGYRTDVPAGFVAGTQAPITVDRTLAGDIVGFQFAGITDATRIHAGQSSPVLVVETNATSYIAGTTSVIDGGAVNLGTNAPSNAVPEPMSMFLMATGLLAIGGIRKFAKK